MLLILDDDLRRIDAFLRAAETLGGGIEVRYWTSAPPMIAELPRFLPAARLISLDHDLYPLSAAEPDPGTGRQVAEFLARVSPSCPLLVHSSNTEAAWGMHNVLESARWPVQLVHHLGEPGWILERWLPVAEAALRAGRRAGSSMTREDER